MHRLYIFIILASLFLSCKKSGSIETVSPGFVGHWQYQFRAGGQTGARVYPNAVTTVLNLNSDKTYQVLTNNSVQQHGTYNITMMKSIYTGNNDNAIDFDSSGLWQIITVQKDTLAISDNFPDGFGTTYVRIK